MEGVEGATTLGEVLLTEAEGNTALSEGEQFRSSIHISAIPTIKFSRLWHMALPFAWSPGTCVAGAGKVPLGLGLVGCGR